MERISQIFGLDLDNLSPLIFTKLDFWIFFVALMVVFSFIHKKVWIRSLFITIVSLFFYFKTSGLFVILLGGSMFWNYYFGEWIHRAKSNRSRMFALVSGISLNILLLIYFKYGFFFTESFNELFKTDFEIFNQFALWGNQWFGENSFDEKLFAAAGLSFITFQSITYLVDINRKQVAPAKTVFDYAFYATFFPHVILGPITRAKDFLPQIYKPYSLTKEDFSWSIVQILKGFIKKLVLADYIAVHFIDKVLDAPEGYPGFVGIVAMWGYSLYIYGDFSGYTDIATGIARLMGFKLEKNFDSPYKARSVADFWRRWHRSLGAFFREYLYIPLGGNVTGGVGSYILITVIMLFLIFITQWYELLYIYLGLSVIYTILLKTLPKFKNYVHRDLNLLITMIIGGLWHGPSENYVIWGAMNGVALVIYKWWRKFSPYEASDKGLSRFWKIFITFNFITFTRIWFRLEEDGKPMAFLEHMKNNFNFSMETLSKMFFSFLPVMIIMILGFIVHWLPQSWKEQGERLYARQHALVQMLIAIVVIVLVYQAVSDVSKPFVYLQY
ncbi:MAG: MBOAT family protein [Bacteroidetes bacterium]|nr:MAG: MBOAT family protein [Bacteroidota bacterium]